MLQIILEEPEMWNEEKQEFVNAKGQTLQLEHSLVSISKWESKWHKAFLGKQPKTLEETLDYVKCMTLTQNVDPATYLKLKPEHFRVIKEYIDSPMSATRISDFHKAANNGETVTSELIYYWMTAMNIPFECQKWHLNRLLTLIRICSIKSQPPKKRSRSEVLRQNHALNEARRKKYNSRG